MTDFKNISHADTVAEETSFAQLDPPDPVPGRELHVDADFVAYMHGYRFEEETLAKSQEFALQTLETLRLMAGAERCVAHLTLGDKSGRHEIARVKEYQAHRQERDPGLQERVSDLRQFMAGLRTPTVQGEGHFTQEADDAMCQIMWDDRDDGNCVLWSKDKDLWMVGGMHINPDTLELEYFPWDYGECWIEELPSGKKLRGRGTSYFWHQLLMGDSADNIPGLPELPRTMVKKYLPLPAYYTKAYARKATTNAQKSAKRKAIDDAEKRIKPKAIGPVLAHQVLAGATTDAEAFHVVRECYLAYYGHSTFQHTAWDGKTSMQTAGSMMIEQAQLLWMRRTYKQDVLDWFKEVL